MSKARLQISALTLTCLLTTACGSFGQIVKERAAFDLNCPAEQLKVTELPGKAYGAEGCNQRVSYTCTMGGFGENKRCYKDSENLTK